ncbi:MAG: transposase family protein [Thermomicrobiales bacterium]|nr:transposase family protein [Thermomicrobiales bacterium]
MKHQLLDILTIAICAILCGEDDWVGVEEWAEIREAELTAWLGLEHGVPSHDTFFGRVFAQIDPVQFEAGFYRWVRRASSIVRQRGHFRISMARPHVVPVMRNASSRSIW